MQAKLSIRSGRQAAKLKQMNSTAYVKYFLTHTNPNIMPQILPFFPLKLLVLTLNFNLVRVKI